jgi:hypothetical protein
VYELNSHVCIVSIEDHCSSARPASGPSKRRNDHGYETEGRTFTTRQEPEVGLEVRLPICHEEGSWRFQACAAKDDGWRPVRDEIPVCSCEDPFVRRITHGGTLDLRQIWITVRDAGPLRIPPARQSSEPDGLALEP